MSNGTGIKSEPITWKDWQTMALGTTWSAYRLLREENERLRAELQERNESPGVNVRLRHTEILMLPRETRSRLLGEWTAAAEMAGLYGSGDKAEAEQQPGGAE